MRDTAIESVQHQPQNVNKNDSLGASEEYEDLFQKVQKQLKQCQDEQEALRFNLMSLLQENHSLSEQLKTDLAKSSIGNLEKSLNDNMKLQLDGVIQERNSAVEMWQTSLQLVSALEKELKDYRDNSHLTSAVEKVHEVRAEYSHAISLLEEKLDAASARIVKDKAAFELAEEKIQHLENNYKLLSERYEKRCVDLNEALIAKETAFQKVETLNKSYSEALADAKEAKLACTELETALERNIARLEEVLTREVEAREKVDEALQIVDVALIERDNALKQATQASEDAQHLQSTISELIAEAGTEVQAEAEKIKEQYNSRIKSVLLDMRRLQVESKSKTSQIQKLKCDLNTLEAELQRTKRELDSAQREQSSLSSLNRKLEGLFRTQELANNDTIRADLEIEQLRAEIVKLNQSNELEQRQYLLERGVLEEQINILQNELENSSQIVTEFSARIDALNATLRHKDHELNVIKKAFSTNSLPHQCKSCLCDPKVLDECNNALKNSQKLCQELQIQLENQRELANKWKSEVNLITSRFQSRLRELHSEASALRKENREIRNQLQVSTHQMKGFQLGSIR